MGTRLYVGSLPFSADEAQRWQTYITQRLQSAAPKGADQIGPLAKIEASPRLDGRNMTMVMAPDKKTPPPKKSREPSASSAGTAPAAPPAPAPENET